MRGRVSRQTQGGGKGILQEVIDRDKWLVTRGRTGQRASESGEILLYLKTALVGGRDWGRDQLQGQERRHAGDLQPAGLIVVEAKHGRVQVTLPGPIQATSSPLFPPFINPLPHSFTCAALTAACRSAFPRGRSKLTCPFCCLTPELADAAQWMGTKETIRDSTGHHDNSAQMGGSRTSSPVD